MEDDKRREAVLTVLLALFSVLPILAVLLTAAGALANRQLVKLSLPFTFLAYVAIGIYAYRSRLQPFTNKLCVGFGAGLVGTLALSIVWGLGGITGFVSLVMPSFLGKLVMGYEAAYKATIVGYLYHYANGAAFGVVYALLFGKARWIVGLGYGAVIWVLMIVTLPMLVMGMGIVGGLKAISVSDFAVISLFAHLVYGAVLGLLVERFVTEKSVVPVILYGGE